MKNFFYKIFALFFNLSRILPVKKNRVALLAPHKGGNHDSLWEIKAYLEAKGGYEIIYIPTAQMNSLGGIINFFLVKARILATSEYVFMNDNFMPMADLKFSDKTKVTMLWHAEGAFKRFGLMTDLQPEIKNKIEKCSNKLTYVICTSESVKSIYAKAFGTDESKVKPLGSPRTDYLFKPHDTDKIRAEFDEKFPQCKGKKLVLYAPTFRDNPERDKNLLSHIDYDLFNRELGSEYALLIKLHPQVHTSEPIKNSIDVTGCDIADLTLICDMVVTDYSSVCMDFALLNKPSLFFAYDLKEYNDERSFCFGYEDYVPGPVVTSFVALIEAIKHPQSDEKLNRFRDFNFDYKDCNNAMRVAEFVTSKQA